MGEISRALAQGSEFEYKGTKYTLSPWTYEIQGKYERYLEEEAVKAARRLSRFLSAEDADRTMAAVMRDIAVGIYSFGSEDVAKSLKSFNHLKYLLWLMIEPNHPDIKISVVNDMLHEEMDMLMEKMNEANSDPTNAMAPRPTETKNPLPVA